MKNLPRTALKLTALSHVAALSQVTALGLALAAALPLSAHATLFGFGKPVESSFERVATFLVCENTSCDTSVIEATVAEITTVSDDGKTLIYTDSPNKLIGFVNIANPEAPAGLGTLAVGGEPTSVAVVGKYVVAAVNTSASLAMPSGMLAIYDLKSCVANLGACAPLRTIALGGQPDSVAVSPDGRFLAIAIENQRDEDITVDGVEGGLPQAPAGFLSIVDVKGAPANWGLRRVELTGLAAYGGNDPETEFVSINQANIAAVTLQENNHIALVHLPTGKVIRDFSAGSVDLKNIDTLDNDRIEFSGNLADVAREPDSVSWLGNGAFVTANEGDLFGGSRGFTLYSISGKPLFDAGSSFEYLAGRIGHYPDGRSDAKGAEPEGIVVARYGNRDLVFVGAERANFVGVYHARGTQMDFVQALPTGSGPEGLLPIPKRDIFVASTENDDPVRSQINIFRLKKGAPEYPQIESKTDKAGKPIAWGALSALDVDRFNANKLFTVHDSFYKASRIYHVDISKAPALIERETVLMKNGVTVNYDLEGIAQRSDGSFWLASEGAGNAPTAGSPNLIVEAAADGTVIREVSLPAAVNARQRSNGFEGVAVTGAVGVDEKVYVAFQRAWTGDAAAFARIGVYTPASDAWAFFNYPLDAASPAGGFVGLSEITALGNGKFAIIERDNLTGPNAFNKRVYTVDVSGLTPVAEGGAFPVLAKTLAIDVLPAMQAGKGWVHDKLEGLARTPNGTVYVVTDNDGVDDSTGETQFLNLGRALD